MLSLATGYRPKIKPTYHRASPKAFYGRGPETRFTDLLSNRKEIQRKTFTQAVDSKDRRELEELLGFAANHKSGKTMASLDLTYYKSGNTYFFIYDHEVFIFN